MAAAEGHLPCVKVLLRGGADPMATYNVRSAWGTTHIVSVEALLEEAAAKREEAARSCFAGDGRVLLADGTTEKRVDTIEVGDRVFTPSGPASVLLIR